jgi:leader peptidase (prepilin peptidase) / N-methyltransferase
MADRIAARWPAHDDGHVRPVDWRTAVTIVLGGAALGALPARFADPAQVLLFGAYFAAFTLLLATDLDQRLLPNRITWPMMLVSLALAVTGLNPLVEGHLLSAILAAIVIPGLLFAVSIPFGAGALGLGDVWLLVSVGLLGGLLRAGAGVFVGVMLAGVVLVALLALRRITLRTYVPFGPFLIIGAYWAILVTL